MLRGWREGRVPEHLRVVVRMGVDESGCKNKATQVYPFTSFCLSEVANVCNIAIVDSDIPNVRSITGAIDNPGVKQQEVVSGLRCQD